MNSFANDIVEITTADATDAFRALIAGRKDKAKRTSFFQHSYGRGLFVEEVREVEDEAYRLANVYGMTVSPVANGWMAKTPPCRDEIGLNLAIRHENAGELTIEFFQKWDA